MVVVDAVPADAAAARPIGVIDVPDRRLPAFDRALENEGGRPLVVHAAAQEPGPVRPGRVVHCRRPGGKEVCANCGVRGVAWAASLEHRRDRGDRRDGNTGVRPTCVFAEPFVVVVTLAMVTVMLMVNVSCDDTA